MLYQGDGKQTFQSAQQLDEDRLPLVKERSTLSFLFKGQLSLSYFKILLYSNRLSSSQISEMTRI